VLLLSYLIILDILWILQNQGLKGAIYKSVPAYQRSEERKPSPARQSCFDNRRAC
jgi:hypothetical protein